MWTAFILYHHSLFARGLEKLLQAQQGVVVTGVEKTSDQAFARLTELRPDVIIIEAEQRESEPEKLFSRFLREQPNARMIRLSLEDNTAILYSGRRCTANSVEDLMQSVVTSLLTEK
jgi:DNA-binding NarL/FixJ family response regulator